jgi:hypothetical protein
MNERMVMETEVVAELSSILINSLRQDYVDYIATCIPIARQRFSKHIPTTHVHATIEE